MGCTTCGQTNSIGNCNCNNPISLPIGPTGPQGLPGGNGTNGTNGTNGYNSYTRTTSSFIQPSVGAIGLTPSIAPTNPVTINVNNTGVNTGDWAKWGQMIYIIDSVGAGGYYQVYSASATVMVVINPGYPSNSTPGITILSTAYVDPAGIRGETGSTNSWGILGNTGTSYNTNFMGTIDNVPIGWRVNNVVSGKLDHILLNTSLGYQSMLNIVTGNNNTAFGNATLYTHQTGNSNSAFGSLALHLSTTGYYNTAIGAESLYNLSAGQGNTAIGYTSSRAVTSGNYNTSVGYQSLLKNVATANTAVGYNALSNLTGSDGNTALGAAAGVTLTGGNNNTIIGSGADVTSATQTNSTVIGNGAIATAHNQVRLGDNNITTMFCKGAYSGTSALIPNMVVDSNGQIMRSTSVNDTGWISLSGFTYYNGPTVPAYRIINKVIYFRGQVVIPMGDGGTGGTGTVISYDTEKTYAISGKQTPYQGVGGVTIIDTDQVLLFNNSSSVIPTVAHYPDADYTAGWVMAYRRVLTSSANTYVDYATMFRVSITSAGILSISTLRDLEYPSISSAVDFKGNSTMRYTVSNVVAGDYCLNYTDVAGGTLQGVTANADLSLNVGVTVPQHTMTLDAAGADCLGGFVFNLDTLRGYTA